MKSSEASRGFSWFGIISFLASLLTITGFVASWSFSMCSFSTRFTLSNDFPQWGQISSSLSLGLSLVISEYSFLVSTLICSDFSLAILALSFFFSSLATSSWIRWSHPFRFKNSIFASILYLCHGWFEHSSVWRWVLHSLHWRF